MTERRVLVVGGGVAGLAAAVALLDEPGIAVEIREAADRLGGMIATSTFAGVAVDEGADAYLTRVPHAVAFAARLGLTDLTSPTDASAAVWHGRLHDIPSGIVLGMPAAIRPFATTSLLSWRGKARAALEPFLPRRDHGDSLGVLMRARFGDEVHERLVDALVGSIYATDTDRSSLAAIPQLAGLADAHRSLLLGGRQVRRLGADRAPSGPIFAAPAAGMATLIEAAHLDIVNRGGTVHVGRPVASITADGRRWRVDDDLFDAVVVAAPAHAATTLLADAAPQAATGLGAIEFADVTMVRLAVPASQWPERLMGRSGYLVPKPVQRFVTAASFGSQKWAHWRPADGTQVLRASLGRDGLAVDHLDDDAIRRHTLDDLSMHLGADLDPAEMSITRWVRAFPQYRPLHHERIRAIEASLPPTIALAGASHRGIGIPACIADGSRAAAQIKESTGHADGFLA